MQSLNKFYKKEIKNYKKTPPKSILKQFMHFLSEKFI